MREFNLEQKTSSSINLTPDDITAAAKPCSRLSTLKMSVRQYRNFSLLFSATKAHSIFEHLLLVPFSLMNFLISFSSSTAKVGFQLRLDFRDFFHIEPSDGCKFDYLEVRIISHRISYSSAKFQWPEVQMGESHFVSLNK